jgi:hypothetical protein
MVLISSIHISLRWSWFCTGQCKWNLAFCGCKGLIFMGVAVFASIALLFVFSLVRSSGEFQVLSSMF